MNFYDDLVMQTQMNYSRHYPIYASGSTPYLLTDKKPLPYSEQIHRLVQEVKEADCVVVGGASGLSAAGGGDFYYEDNDSYRKYFRPFAEKYHFKGAFAGMMHPWKTREEYWGYLATFLHTTQTAPVRHSYLDLGALLKGKDFFILTTNQDTQFVKLYPEEKVAEIQGDHRFFQCAACCTDDTWDAVKPVADMVAAMGGWHEDSHGSYSPVPSLRRRGIPLGARIWEFPARKEIRRTVRKNFSLCAGTQRQQNSVPRAGRWPNDSHVYPRTFLEPDPQLSPCSIYCCQQQV